MKRRSIGERLARTKSLDVRREIALDWTANWIQDHEGVISEIEKALTHKDAEAAGRHLGQLKSLSNKRMTTLVNVIEKLSDDDVE